MNAPIYPDSREITLDDKPMFDMMFERMQPRISEFTFAGLYLFRNAHSYRLTGCEDSMVILGKGYDGNEYFLPPLEGNIAAALGKLLSEGMLLYGADEVFVDRYLGRLEGIVIEEDRDAFDYLYRRMSLAELPGNRYHKKKNRINYFISRYSSRIEPYSRRHLDGALSLLEEWRAVRSGVDSRSFDAEVEAAAEGLHLADRLGLTGVVVLVADRIRAFALGERLNALTSVCHFEKADPFLEGIYQLVDREFNRLCYTDCMYVNREQDLGEPNLRKSKLSYHPVELVKKFRVKREKTR